MGHIIEGHSHLAAERRVGRGGGGGGGGGAQQH